MVNVLVIGAFHNCSTTGKQVFLQMSNIVTKRRGVEIDFVPLCAPALKSILQLVEGVAHPNFDAIVDTVKDHYAVFSALPPPPVVLKRLSEIWASFDHNYVAQMAETPAAKLNAYKWFILATIQRWVTEKTQIIMRQPDSPERTQALHNLTQSLYIRIVGDVNLFIPAGPVDHFSLLSDMLANESHHLNGFGINPQPITHVLLQKPTLPREMNGKPMINLGFLGLSGTPILSHANVRLAPAFIDSKVSVDNQTPSLWVKFMTGAPGSVICMTPRGSSHKKNGATSGTSTPTNSTISPIPHHTNRGSHGGSSTGSITPSGIRSPQLSSHRVSSVVGSAAAAVPGINAWPSTSVISPGPVNISRYSVSIGSSVSASAGSLTPGGGVSPAPLHLSRSFASSSFGAVVPSMLMSPSGSASPVSAVRFGAPPIPELFSPLTTLRTSSPNGSVSPAGSPQSSVSPYLQLDNTLTDEELWDMHYAEIAQAEPILAERLRLATPQQSALSTPANVAAAAAVTSAANVVIDGSPESIERSSTGTASSSCDSLSDLGSSGNSLGSSSVISSGSSVQATSALVVADKSSVSAAAAETHLLSAHPSSTAFQMQVDGTEMGASLDEVVLSFTSMPPRNVPNSPARFPVRSTSGSSSHSSSRTSPVSRKDTPSTDDSGDSLSASLTMLAVPSIDGKSANSVSPPRNEKHARHDTPSPLRLLGALSPYRPKSAFSPTCSTSPQRSPITSAAASGMPISPLRLDGISTSASGSRPTPPRIMVPGVPRNRRLFPPVQLGMSSSSLQLNQLSQTIAASAATSPAMSPLEALSLSAATTPVWSHEQNPPQVSAASAASASMANEAFCLSAIPTAVPTEDVNAVSRSIDPNGPRPVPAARTTAFLERFADSVERTQLRSSNALGEQFQLTPVLIRPNATAGLLRQRIPQDLLDSQAQFFANLERRTHAETEQLEVSRNLVSK